MHHQRLTDRLTQIWNTIRKQETLPDFTRFNRGTIEDMWPYCATVAIEPGGTGPVTVRYVDLGDMLTKLYGSNLSGHHVRIGQKNVTGADALKHSLRVIADKEPSSDAGQFINDRNKIVKYRSCLLPFGGDDKGVTHMLLGMSWREF